MKILLRVVVMAVLLLPVLGVGASQHMPGSSDIVVLQIVLTSQGNGKVTTQTHSLELPADGKAGSIRSGMEVPFTANGRTVLQQLGALVDVMVTADTGGRFKVALTITNRALYEDKQAPQIQQMAGSLPVFRNFIVATTTYLKDGQNTLATATDILTNETWQANVTLSLKK